MNDEAQNGASIAPAPRLATCDQEAWVHDRILAAMKMALALRKEQRVRADEPAFEYGLRGIAEGCAIEVIETLGMRPVGVNLRLPSVVSAIGGIAANLGNLNKA